MRVAAILAAAVALSGVAEGVSTSSAGCLSCTRAQRSLVSRLHRDFPDTDILVQAKKLRGDIENLCSDAPTSARSGTYEVLLSSATTAAVSALTAGEGKASEYARAHCSSLAAGSDRDYCEKLAGSASALHGSSRGHGMVDLLLQGGDAWGSESHSCALLGACGEVLLADSVPAARGSWIRPGIAGARSAKRLSGSSFLATSDTDGARESRETDGSRLRQSPLEEDARISDGGDGFNSEESEDAAAAGDSSGDEDGSSDGLTREVTEQPHISSLKLLPGTERLGVAYNSYGEYLSPQTIFRLGFTRGEERVDPSAWRHPGSNVFYFAQHWYKVPDHLSVIPCAAFEQGFRASEVFDRDKRSGAYGGGGNVGVSDMGDVFGANANAQGSHSYSESHESDRNEDDKLIIFSKYAVQARTAMSFPEEQLNPAFVRDLEAAQGYSGKSGEREYVAGFFGVWGDKVVSRRIFGGVIREHSSSGKSSDTYSRSTAGSGSADGKGVAEGAKINGGINGNFQDSRSEEDRTSSSSKTYSIYGGPPGLSGELPTTDRTQLNFLFNRSPYAIVSCSADVTSFIPRVAKFNRARSILSQGISDARKSIRNFHSHLASVKRSVDRVRDAYRVIKSYDNRAWIGAHEKLTGTKLKAVLNRCERLNKHLGNARSSLSSLTSLVGNSAGKHYEQTLNDAKRECDHKISHWDAYPSDFTKRSVGWCLGKSTFWRCTPGTD